VHQEAVVNGNGNNNKKKRRRLFIYGGIGLALVLLIAIGVFAATRGGTKIDPSKLAKVEKGDLAKSVVATGKVTPIIKVEVKSKASGIVKKLLVDYGDRVKKGQLLAQLDKIEIEAQVEQSRASLEAADANLKSTQADLERAKVDAEGPDVPLLKRAYDRAISSEGWGSLRLSAGRCGEKLRACPEQTECIQGAGYRFASEDCAGSGAGGAGSGESETA
jgi:HlyD family secretion protein